MNFAVIAPTTFVEKRCKLRTVSMCLAQHYIADERYRKLYSCISRKDNIVILDNGAYEGEIVTPQQLVWVMKNLRPTVAVLPDVPGDAKASTDAADFFRTMNPGYKYMRVLHGRFEECVSTYKSSTDPWIGFSKLLHFPRVDLIRHLRAKGLWKRGVMHHALGMQNNDTATLASLNIYSIDSSSPVWRSSHPDYNEPFNINGEVDEKLAWEAVQRMDEACFSL